MHFEQIDFPAFALPLGRLVALTPLKGEHLGMLMLLVLNEAGELWKLDLLSAEGSKLASVDVPEWNTSHPVQMIMSPNERFVAISNVYGQHAVLIDLDDSREIMKLSRDDYHFNVCTYPLAFTEREGRTLLIHGTEWNRLDITDVHSGKKLTDRETPIYDRENKPEHYLDYFHSKLHVSGNGEWIVDTGWIWHPIGIIRSWNIAKWILNPWESEDDTSVQELWDALEDWDYPAVWVDEHIIGIWGLVNIDLLDEEEQTADNLSFKLILVDVRTGERKRTFTNMPSYSTKTFIEGVYPHNRAQITVSGGKYFLWAPECEMCVWNMDDSRLEANESICPDIYHSVAKVFLKADDRGQFTGWRYV